ncbi:MAG: orotate phosphoribosyltransferase [Actinomycetota bacterium]
MSETKQAILKLIMEQGYERREEAFKLSSGEWSRDYIDAKRAISDGDGLKLAGEALNELAQDAGADFEAVGGLTMGADALAHAVSILSGAKWFSVRKEAKSHGQRRLIEGAELKPGMRVFLLDDVISTGASILKALDAVAEDQVEVCLATSLVDRGKTAKAALESRGLLYRPLLTFGDLGIDPIGVN